MTNGGTGDRTRLTVLSVAFPLFTVGRGEGGGAEEILGLIDDGLTKCGHRSIVIARSGSRVSGELWETPAINGEISDDVREHAQQLQRQAIRDVLTREQVDLIHFHGVDFLSYRPQECLVPQLATLHLPLTWYPPDLFAQPRLAINLVSYSQAASLPKRGVSTVIPNGINLDQFTVSPKRGYVAWLGRICPEKAPHVALRVAHRAGLPLLLAGPVHAFTAHRDYYVEQLLPQLDEQCKYIGPVTAATRSRFLAEACCLLVPSFVAETSSLVAMEAIASGTPVVAFRSGALPEIIDHGVTGFIVDSEDAMVEAIGAARELSSRACRSVAEQRFSAERMVGQYIMQYRNIIRSELVTAE